MLKQKGNMHFSSIKNEIKTLSFETLRTDCENFFEAVVIQEEIEKLNLRLQGLFGEAAYPSDSSLEPKVQKIIDGLGGIMPGQTLYYKDFGNDSIFAMLWPWKDGVHTTIKIILR